MAQRRARAGWGGGWGGWGLQLVRLGRNSFGGKHLPTLFTKVLTDEEDPSQLGCRVQMFTSTCQFSVWNPTCFHGCGYMGKQTCVAKVSLDICGDNGWFICSGVRMPRAQRL